MTFPKGRVNGRDCVVYLNGHRFSGDVAAFDINTGREALRANNLARKANVRLPGLSNFDLNCRVWATANDVDWRDIQALPAKDEIAAFIVAFGEASGSLMFAGNALVTAATWNRGDDGSLSGNCNLSTADQAVGWFNLVFPIGTKANKVVTGIARRVSDPVDKVFLPANEDLLLWLDQDISAASITAYTPSILATSANALVDGWTLTPALNRTQLTVMRRFGPNSWPPRVAPSNVSFRFGWASTAVFGLREAEVVIASGLVCS